jgi:protein-S-isoprenylcysteine O-methyltransferase Ste14
MIVLWMCVAGVVAFAGATLICGSWLQRNPSKKNAEWSSRLMHLLFFLLLNFPPALLFVYPGVTRLDAATGLAPLEPWALFAALGLVLAPPGFYLLVVTNKALRALGNGANAFRLTRHVVSADVYRRTRNPMSLGFYLWVVGIALMTGSSTFTLLALFGIVPAHLLFLLFFEARELPLRLGPPYEDYKRRTPFLLPFGRPQV